MKVTYELGSVADWLSGIGSLAAVFVALLGYFLVERQRRLDRRKTEEALAYELAASLGEIVNNIRQITRHVRENQHDAKFVGLAGKPNVYKNMHPLVGLTTEGAVRLPIGSAELFVKANAIDVWNDAILLVAKNRALTENLREYRLVHDRIRSLLPPPSQTDGLSGSFEMDLEECAKLELPLIQADALIRGLIEQTDEADALSIKVADSIGPTFKAHFGGAFLHIVMKEPAEISDAEKG